jgi:hypothetical protein
MNRPVAALANEPQLDFLHPNLDAGHAGAAGRFDRFREVALACAFAIRLLAQHYELLWRPASKNFQGLQCQRQPGHGSTGDFAYAMSAD